MGKKLTTFLMVWLALVVVAQAKGILALSSEAPGDPWQSKLQQTVEQGLRGQKVPLQWRYFTAKQMTQSTASEAVLSLLTAEFTLDKPEYLLVTDLVAYRWVTGVGSQWRGKIPLVFGFSQSFSPLQLVGVQHVTGVVIQPDLQRLISSAIGLNPKTTDLLIVNDPQGPGENLKNRFARLASMYPKLTFTFVEGLDLSELAEEAKKWPQGSLVVLGNTPWIKKGLSVPSSFLGHYVIPLYETQLDQGAVGGPVVTVPELSKHIVEIFDYLLASNPSKKLAPVWLTAERNLYVLDRLEQLNIPEEHLAVPFKIIGEHPVVYGGWLLSLSLVGCFILGVATFYLGYYFLKKLKAEQTLKEANLSLTSQISTNTEQLDQIYQQVYHELSQRKGAEKALFASEQRFKAFVDHTPVGILVSNPQGRVEYVNRTLSQILEAEPEGIEQKKVIDYFPNDLVVFPDAAQETVEQENQEWPLRKDSGEELVLMSKTAIYFSGDGASKAITFVLDITELKQTETRLRSANQKSQIAVKAKAEFLATMSHEIRTPLNSVIGMSSLLRQTTLDEEQQDLVESVISSGESLLMILNGILDYSKIEAGQMELERSPVNLVSAVDKVTQMLMVQAEPKGLQLDYHVSTDLPSTMQFDEMRLNQVLLNLIGNAVKFTLQGQVNVHVFYKPVQQRVRFEVKDTGIGVSPDNQKMLFQAFQQVDGSLSRDFGGTGLGLAICQKLVGLMGGEIEVDSDGLHGSTFSFELPLLKVNGPMKPFESAKTFSFDQRRVLWISDNLARTAAVVDWLEYWGVQVTVVTSDFWHAGLLVHPWSLVMLDQRLLQISTETLWKEIQMQVKGPKLCFVSSFEGKRGGDTMTTPFNPRHLFEHLEGVWGHLEQKRKTQAHWVYPDLARSFPMSILVVDDNPLNLKLTLKMLDQMGYRADTAVNGKIAVDLVLKNQYQLVFMDIQMPVLDGISAVKQIWEKLGDRRPKCVALTANANADDLLHYQSIGFDNTLTKPLMPETFAEHLTMWGQFFDKQQHSTDLA